RRPLAALHPEQEGGRGRERLTVRRRTTGARLSAFREGQPGRLSYASGPCRLGRPDGQGGSRPSVVRLSARRAGAVSAGGAPVVNNFGGPGAKPGPQPITPERRRGR